MHLLVHEAGLQDHQGGKELLAPLRGRFPRLKLIWADSGYAKGGLSEWVQAVFGWTVELVEHPWSGLRSAWTPNGRDMDWTEIRPKGFHVLPRRWVVERTFAWLSTWRRLSKDYELLTSSEEAWISLAMIGIMLRRLAQDTS